MIGQTISRYRLDEKLGEGGVGVVYRAFDLRLGRTVALKMLRPEFASNAAVSRSLATEAHAASALNHPAIATLFDFETTDAAAFLVYEYIRGRTLRDIGRERRLGPEEIVTLFINIAEGVAGEDVGQPRQQEPLSHSGNSPGNITGNCRIYVSGTT
jgi:serine/threonine protein kinase